MTMTDSYGRTTNDEISTQLKRLIDDSPSCKTCVARSNCPFFGQVCAMFTPEKEEGGDD